MFLLKKRLQRKALRRLLSTCEFDISVWCFDICYIKFDLSEKYVYQFTKCCLQKFFGSSKQFLNVKSKTHFVEVFCTTQRNSISFEKGGSCHCISLPVPEPWLPGIQWPSSQNSTRVSVLLPACGLSLLGSWMYPGAALPFDGSPRPSVSVQAHATAY